MQDGVAGAHPVSCGQTLGQVTEARGQVDTIVANGLGHVQSHFHRTYLAGGLNQVTICEVGGRGGSWNSSIELVHLDTCAARGYFVYPSEYADPPCR